MTENSRVWLITGTTSGLGKALVETVLAKGDRVVATARRPEQLAYLERTYPKSQLLVQRLDVTVPEEILSVFENTKSHFNRLDIVVNNAGMAVLGEAEGTPDEDARMQFEIMYWGPVNIIRETMKMFRDVNPKGQGGIIFNISTAGGYSANPTISFYNSSKFALEGFTEALRKEILPEWNIQACIIEPGGMDTEWGKGSMKILPQHPAYAVPHGVATQFRELLAQAPFIGLPDRAAKVIVDLADERDLPLRIQFGSDALAIIRHKARKTISDSEKWGEKAHQCNKDGIDQEQYMEQIALSLS